MRLDGDTPANPENPNASRGQIVVLDGSRAGQLDGITRQAYDGTELPVTEADLQEAQVTTRDIDRGAYPHFLLKEITEAPTSFRKTLRGKLVERDGRMQVALDDDVLSTAVRQGLRDGSIGRVQVIGQGTAHVAGQSLASALVATHPRRAPAGRGPPRHRALGLRAARRTCATRSSSRSASRARPPTRTAPSTSCAIAAPRCWPS